MSTHAHDMRRPETAQDQELGPSPMKGLTSREPPIFERSLAKVFERDEPWHEQRLRVIEDGIRKRLGDLSSRLGDADWLDGAFSAGDLLMVTVLRRLQGSGILEEYPNLAAYVARGEARPAYQRAFADHLSVFRGSQPPRETNET
mgnify:CR=1 FL=1